MAPQFFVFHTGDIPSAIDYAARVYYRNQTRVRIEKLVDKQLAECQPSTAVT